MRVEPRMTVKERRDYLNRFKQLIDKKGIEYVLEIVDAGQLKRFFMCLDWLETDMSRDRVARLHKYHQKTNFCKMCGPKSQHKIKKRSDSSQTSH